MRLRDRYWLAGMLEGEGTFFATKNKPHQPSQPRVAFVSTDRDIVVRIWRLMEAKTVRVNSSHNRLGKKRQWVTAISSTKAAALMRLIWPIMGKRRKKQIRKALNRGAF